MDDDTCINYGRRLSIKI